MGLLSVPFGDGKGQQSSIGDKGTHRLILSSSSDFRAVTRWLVSTCDSAVLLNRVREGTSGELHRDVSHK